MSNFKVVKFLGFDWLKNATKEGGAMGEIINNKKVNEIVLHHLSKKYEKSAELRLWGSCDPSKLLEMITTNNYLYEVIDKLPHKVYFDIDEDIAVGGVAIPLETHLNKINEILPDGDIAVSGSITEKKASYHITLNNYLIQSAEDRNIIKTIAKTLGWDDRVYTKNRNMKLVNQSKPDGRVQHPFEKRADPKTGEAKWLPCDRMQSDNDLKKHVITSFFNTNIKQYPNFDKINNRELDNVKLAVKIEKVKTKPLNIAKMPARAVREINNLDEFDLQTASAEELLNILPLCATDDHTYTHQCARFCFYNNLTFDDFINWRQQKRELTESDLQRWSKHWEDLNKFPKVSMDTMRYIILAFYPNLISNKHFRNYKKLFNIYDNSIINKVDRLEQDVFNTNDKYVVINTQMGSGKTTQSIEYLKNAKSFIWMTPLISLAQNTKHRLDEEGIYCKFYKECKNAEEKQALNEEEKLLICINSLKYINDNEIRANGKIIKNRIKYNVVIIDEIETLLNKWFNNKTLDGVKYNCWENFVRIIRDADKVILLDAFTSKITIDFIRSIEYARCPPLIIERHIETSNRQIQFVNHYQKWTADIIADLNAGKKLFIFYPFKNGQPKKGIPSMEGFKNMIVAETGKCGKYYHGEANQADTKDLYNVNESWKDLNFIITNTKITVGINYEGHDFDRVYMGIAGMNSARDILQVSYRCRNLNDELIKIAFIEKYNTNIDFKNDSILLESPECSFCPIYKDLVKNLLIERYTPLQESVLYLCKMAHYTIIDSDDFIDSTLKDKFKQLVKDNNIIYEYASIEDIDDIQHYEPLLYANEATQMQQIQVRKFYFNLLWVDDWIAKRDGIEMPDPEEYKKNKALAWDKKYFEFMNATNTIIYDRDSNFKKIFDLMKPYFNNNIMPTLEGLSNIVAKKIKLPDVLLDMIFENFHFKYISKKSSTVMIIKTIYNTFFNKHIIDIEYQGNRHNLPNFKISEEAIDLFKFMSQYLRKKYWYDNIEIEEEAQNDDNIY